MMKGEEDFTAKKMIEVISKTNLHMKIKMVSRQLNQQGLRHIQNQLRIWVILRWLGKLKHRRLSKACNNRALI